jgi:hypothetical protein
MKKLVASMICVAFALSAMPVGLLAQATGQISGQAMVEGRPMANGSVQLRNVDTGQIVSKATADANGNFSFSNLGPGNFVVETLDATGNVIGTSAKILLAAGAMVATGVTVSGSAAAAAGLAGAAAGGGGFFGTTAGIVTLSAIGVGAAAGIAVAATGS